MGLFSDIKDTLQTMTWKEVQKGLIIAKEDIFGRPDYAYSTEDGYVRWSQMVGNDPSKVNKHTISASEKMPKGKYDALARIWAGKHEVTIDHKAASTILYVSPKDGRAGGEATIIVSPESLKGAVIEEMEENVSFSGHGRWLSGNRTDDNEGRTKGKLTLSNDVMIVFDERQRNPVTLKVGDKEVRVWQYGDFAGEIKDLTAQLQSAAAKEKDAVAHPATNPNADLPNLNQKTRGK